MCLKHLSVIGLLIGLGGCTLINKTAAPVENIASPTLCPLQAEQSTEIQPSCDLTPWITYWIDVSQSDWSSRKSIIAELNPNDNDLDRLKVILLSHVNNTPYQPRLRAQSYAQTLLENQQETLAKFIRFILYEPAQRRLELESAITTLSRINTENNRQLDTHKATIEQQARQINQLLQIEKTMVKPSTEEQQ